MDEIMRLVAIQDIIFLRARHNRFIDERNWANIAELFASDFVYERPSPPVQGQRESALERYEEAEAMVEILKSNGSGAITAHHACLPEIEIIDAHNAIGLWAVAAQVYAEDAPHEEIYRLAGYCHDSYRKIDDVWRFTSIRLERLYAMRAR